MENERIMIVRHGALGDVILTEPIIRTLKEEESSRIIGVRTHYPDVFKNNPYVDSVNELFSYDRLINLDLVYERNPNIHIVDAYAAAAGVTIPDVEKQAVIYSTDAWWIRSTDSTDTKNKVVLHPAITWRSRTIETSVWLDVVKRLEKKGYFVQIVGSKIERQKIDTHGVFEDTDLHGLVAKIKTAVAFIGPDSGVLHVAGTTPTPIIGVFTSVRPDYRLPYREGVLGGGCAAVIPNISCQFCLERQPPPVTFCGCEFDGKPGAYACVSAITADTIMEALQQTIGCT